MAGMSEFERLPDQSLTAVSEPPPMDGWREAMRNSLEVQALQLRAVAIGNLTNFSDNRWRPFVNEAEAILRERGIGF